jgi:hypothetical protein
MNEGAQRYLAQRLSVAREQPSGTDVLNWRRQMLGGFGGALEALQWAGVISTDEQADWSNRMQVAVGVPPRAPIPPRTNTANSVSATGRAIYIGEGEPPPRPAPPPLARFLGLMPVEAPDQALPFGGRVQILGLERYDTKVVVVWRIAPLPDPEKQFASELAAEELDSQGLPDAERQMMRHQHLSRLHARGGEKVSLSDDLNTEYHNRGGGSGGSGAERVGRSEFMPAMPEVAAQLTVHWNDLAFMVALPSR